MPIYLVQHGSARPKAEDPGRSLSPQGAESVRRIAEVARHYSVEVAVILHSGKKRAEETATIFAECLQPKGGVVARDGLAPLDDVELFAAELQGEENCMVVGHLPFLERLVSVLTTGSQEFIPFSFQNGGLVCLKRSGDSGLWSVKWALMPEIG